MLRADGIRPYGIGTKGRRKISLPLKGKAAVFGDAASSVREV